MQSRVVTQSRALRRTGPNPRQIRPIGPISRGPRWLSASSLIACWRRPSTRRHRPLLSRHPASTSSSSLDAGFQKWNPPVPVVDGYRPPRSIAVLGGGLTGLTTAFFLTHSCPPGTKIVLYESTNRLGGWIDVEEVEVPGGRGTVRFDRGARVLPTQNTKAKWDDLVLWDMVARLGLEREVVGIENKDALKLKRYVYYPDRLVSLSFEGWRDYIRLFTEPAFEGVFYFGLSFLFNWLRGKAKYRKTCERLRSGLQMRWIEEKLRDQSIGDFYSTDRSDARRKPVDNLLSALVHGVHGGDVWRLSMESGMFSRQFIEATVGVPKSSARLGWSRLEDVDLMGYYVVNHSDAQDPVGMLAEAGMELKYVGFRRGMPSLTEALERYLRGHKDVEIRTDEPVQTLRSSQDGKAVAIMSSARKKPERYDKVISTLFAGTLAKLAGEGQLPTLAQSEAVTMQVVNLWFPKEKVHHPHEGFGYLLPQSAPHNEAFVLGVLFDSDRESLMGAESDSAGGTKMTVMMGGHYMRALGPEAWPTADQACRMAKQAVQQHLKLPDEAMEGVVARSKLCTDCIPQHTVGHMDRLETAHTELLRAFGGRLGVVGSSYQTPGVLSSLRAARDMALQVGCGRAQPFPSPYIRNWPEGPGETGLEWIIGPAREIAWGVRSKKDMAWRLGVNPLKGFVPLTNLRLMEEMIKAGKLSGQLVVKAR